MSIEAQAFWVVAPGRGELRRITGNACRERRRFDESVRHLAAAVAAAIALNDPELEGLASMSLAATEVLYASMTLATEASISLTATSGFA